MVNKPKKKSLWRRFKEWCYYNDFRSKVGVTIAAIIFGGAIIAFAVWACMPEPGDLIAEGVVIDMGHYVPGGSAKQYGCWIKVRTDDGTVGTWAISDTTYETIAIGDRVEKTEVKP